MVKRIDLTLAYRAEAHRIAEAHNRMKLILSSGDIRAAGNEVEHTLRAVISERLPWRYRTTHGHILDYQATVSSQLDVIIAENLAARGLFETSDGTEYVPYESVYAVGEIKATYDRSRKPIQEFSAAIRSLRTGLNRQSHVNNSLLTFMVFAKAGDFSVADLEAFYKDTPIPNLPNFVCLLDLGVIVRTKFLCNDAGDPVPVSYLLGNDAAGSDEYRWALLEWGEKPVREATVLMFLHLSLIQHLQQCATATPNLYPYLALALDVKGGQIFESTLTP